MTITKYLLFGVFVFGTWACGHDHATDQAHADEAQMEGPHADNEVDLTREQVAKIGLEMSSMEKKNLNATLKVNGLLALPPQNMASVSPLLGGMVQKIHVKPGQYVRSGEALVILQNPELIDMQQSYLETAAELTFLEEEYQRQKGLVEKEIAARKQFEKIESERAVARARMQGLESKFQILGITIPAEGKKFTSVCTVRSPINGYVRRINIHTGEYAGQSQELFEIVDNHHIHIDLMVFEKDIPHLSVDQKIRFILQSSPSQVMEARIFAIGKALDKEQRAVPVHAEIENKSGQLLPGMYVEARIILESRDVPALPLEAITKDKGLDYIFVLEQEMENELHFLKIPVLTGTEDMGYKEVTVLEEIPDNARIVTKGAYFLMAQTKKGEEGGGHHH